MPLAELFQAGGSLFDFNGQKKSKKFWEKY